MLIVWFSVYKKLAQFAVRGALPPRRSESPGCAADNKPSCVLHLLGWFIGSHGFSSLEQRPEFWVLHWLKTQHSKNEDHGIWSHHFMANRWEDNGNSEKFYFGRLQNNFRW